MTNKQPEALRLAELLELAPEDGIEPQTTEDAAAELRRQHARIAELEARIKAMAEEHADELMVAHLDGRMRAAQPAGAEVVYSTPEEMFDAILTPQPAPATQQASQQEPVAWYVTGCGRLLDEDEAKAEARHIGGTAMAIPLYTAPQADSVTAPAAYSGNLEQELAMLIRRIVSSARRNCEDGSNVLKLANEAWVYIVRKGLNGSPLRDAGIESDPTPPAQAADSVLEDAGGANWQDISTAPKDGTRFVAVGNNYGLYSETQHTCIAQWFRGCWMEVSDWNEASELKYLTHWMPLPPLPCSAARARLEDAARVGMGVAHTLSDAQIEAMPVWRNFVGLWPESRREIVDAVVDLLAAAPTPPAQVVDSVLEDAARLDWLLLHISGAEFRRIGVHYSGNASRADVDAARAAQEGKSHGLKT